MNNNKITDLRKEIVMLNTFELKPNYSFLAKKYDLDPRTIKNTMKVMKEKKLIEISHQN